MRSQSLGALLAVVVATLSVTGGVRADDTADEADLLFQLGAEAYQRGEYREALKHFLGSNRLVPNRNVLFNIARAYEKLRQYPEAYRYFVAALEAEKDPAARGRIEDAMAQIKGFVAVVQVVTDPPGATLYVDRKDLGSRGESPKKLGLSGGSYKIIAEAPGYEAAEIKVSEVKAGKSTKVELRLKQILGTLSIEGAAGALVRVDDESRAPSCTAPCRLSLPPGPHTLYVGRPGYRTDTVPVTVRPRAVTVVRPDVQALLGEIVVSTDEPGALIELDDKPVGFSPSIVRAQVGKHRLRVGLRGFRDVERDVVVQKDQQTRVELTLTQSEEVIAASRSTQNVEDAPSSVTLIPGKELQVMAYPTIAEAVRGVRGIYQWDDRAYVSLGVRGVGRLGSYGNRLLVLVDGMPLNDNWIGSSYVGYDARTDLADVERIEVVRGPGSVLYGTNAVSGVLNLVTRSRGVPSGGEVGASTNLDGVARARARGNLRLGRDAGVWTSVAAARSSGRDFYFQELASAGPPAVDGHARNVDGFRSATVAGRAWWKFVSAQWQYHDHDKKIPTGQYGTLLDDSRTHQRDTRLFVEATAEPNLGSGVSLFSRAHLDHYRFFGAYARDAAGGGVERDTYRGSWLGLEQRVVFEPSPALRFTVGGEGQLHFQVDQRAEDDAGPFLAEEGADGRPFQVGALYALTDLEPDPAVKVSAGARLDAYSTFGSSVNPRLALLFRPYSAGNLKLLGGKAFRAPSVYELYYNDGGATQVSSPDLDPETVYSAEIEHTHRFGPTLSGTVSLFGNYVKNLIDQSGGGTAADPISYVNVGTPLVSLGAEAEVRREWRQGWMLGASYGYTRTTLLAGEGLDDLTSLREDPSVRRVGNVPEHLATLKGAVPILGRNVTLGSRLTIEGPRYDRAESSADPEAQGRTSGFAIWDVVISGYESHWGLRWAAGVYNAFDWRYSLPVSSELTQARLPQNGRTFLLSGDVTF
jgi:outer membrane receptor protein involved in Fe transport